MTYVRHSPLFAIHMFSLTLNMCLFMRIFSFYDFHCYNVTKSLTIHSIEVRRNNDFKMIQSISKEKLWTGFSCCKRTKGVT